MTAYDPAPLYWSLAAVVVIMVAAFAVTRYFTGRRENVMQAQIAELYEKFGVPVPISTAFQTVLVKQMTHYHTPVLDELMAKMLAETLTDADRVELAAALKEREQDMGSMIDASERGAAKLLPLIMERVVLEKAQTVKGFNVILVKVPKAADE